MLEYVAYKSDLQTWGRMRCTCTDLRARIGLTEWLADDDGGKADTDVRFVLLIARLPCMSPAAFLPALPPVTDKKWDDAIRNTSFLQCILFAMRIRAWMKRAQQWANDYRPTMAAECASLAEFDKQQKKTVHDSLSALVEHESPIPALRAIPLSSNAREMLARVCMPGFLLNLSLGLPPDVVPFLRELTPEYGPMLNNYRVPEIPKYTPAHQTHRYDICLRYVCGENHFSRQESPTNWVRLLIHPDAQSIELAMRMFSIATRRQQKNMARLLLRCFIGGKNTLTLFTYAFAGRHARTAWLRHVVHILKRVYRVYRPKFLSKFHEMTHAQDNDEMWRKLARVLYGPLAVDDMLLQSQSQSLSRSSVPGCNAQAAAAAKSTAVSSDKGDNGDEGAAPRYSARNIRSMTPAALVSYVQHSCPYEELWRYIGLADAVLIPRLLREPHAFVQVYLPANKPWSHKWRTVLLQSPELVSLVARRMHEGRCDGFAILYSNHNEKKLLGWPRDIMACFVYSDTSSQSMSSIAYHILRLYVALGEHAFAAVLRTSIRQTLRELSVRVLLKRGAEKEHSLRTVSTYADFVEITTRAWAAVDIVHIGDAVTDYRHFFCALPVEFDADVYDIVRFLLDARARQTRVADKMSDRLTFWCIQYMQRCAGISALGRVIPCTSYSLKPENPDELSELYNMIRQLSAYESLQIMKQHMTSHASIGVSVWWALLRNMYRDTSSVHMLREALCNTQFLSQCVDIIGKSAEAQITNNDIGFIMFVLLVKRCHWHVLFKACRPAIPRGPCEQRIMWHYLFQRYAPSCDWSTTYESERCDVFIQQAMLR